MGYWSEKKKRARVEKFRDTRVYATASQIRINYVTSITPSDFETFQRRATNQPSVREIFYFHHRVRFRGPDIRRSRFRHQNIPFALSRKLHGKEWLRRNTVVLVYHWRPPTCSRACVTHQDLLLIAFILLARAHFATSIYSHRNFSHTYSDKYLIGRENLSKGASQVIRQDCLDRSPSIREIFSNYLSGSKDEEAVS